VVTLSKWKIFKSIVTQSLINIFNLNIIKYINNHVQYILNQFQIVIQVDGLLIKHLEWFLYIRLTFHKNPEEIWELKINLGGTNFITSYDDQIHTTYKNNFLIILYKMDVHLKDWISFLKTQKIRLGPYDYEGSEIKNIKFITNTIMVKHYVEK